MIPEKWAEWGYHICFDLNALKMKCPVIRYGKRGHKDGWFPVSLNARVPQ